MCVVYSVHRYDRAYVRSAGSASAECVLCHVHDSVRAESLTDHAAVCVELRLQQAGEAALGPLPLSSAGDVFACSAASGQRQVDGQPIQHVRVIGIANKVVGAVHGFRSTALVCLDFDKTPSTTVLQPADRVVDWAAIPTACGFKVERPGGRANQHHATKTERRDMAISYTKFAKWAAGCGCDDASLQELLESCALQKKRPSLLRCFQGSVRSGPHSSVNSQQDSAILRCRLEGLRKAASAAGRVLGGDEGEAAASREIDRLLALNAAELSTALEDIPTAWKTETGLRLSRFDLASCQWLPGLFEYWLRAEGSRIMSAEARWEEIRIAAARGESTDALADVEALPTFFVLDGNAYTQAVPSYGDSNMLRVGKAPFLNAWWRLTWAAACDEVSRRYSYDLEGLRPRGHIRLRSLDVTWTALDLYKRLFGTQGGDENSKRRADELSELYVSLDMCLGRHRTQRDAGHVLQGLTRGFVDRKTLAHIWDDFVKAQQHTGSRWADWVSVSPFTITPDTKEPAYLQICNVTPEMVEDCGSGKYKWGTIEVHNMDGSTSAAEEISRIWTDRKAQKIDVDLLRQQRQKSAAALLENDTVLRSGHLKELKRGKSEPVYRGRLWSDGDKYYFQEDSAHKPVEYSMPKHSQAAGKGVDEHLYKKVRAAHVKAKQNAEAEARKRAGVVHKPSSIGDMAVRGKTPEGKLIYEFHGTEVPATPRAMRPDLAPGKSASWNQKWRETTPSRALRKMREKIDRIVKRSAEGKHAPIIAKGASACEPGPLNESLPHPSGPAIALGPDSMEADLARSDALSSLKDPTYLAYAREAFHYLDSGRLFHCRNCDEEWLVFDQEWPQGGVGWAGPLAGKCETIARAGFEQSWKDRRLCKLCGQRGVYATMFSEANCQHLGPRYDALSNLTWYESLLIARVHPVVSVITLTATGQLCYAGHVCNYYMKVLEWFKGLPAILRDKKWFLIKRRRSIGATAGETTQKKPTTANRRRLEAAILEAQRRMPHVFEGSVVHEEELAKFPLDAEREILEPVESVDLQGDVKIDRDTFRAWMDTETPPESPSRCSIALKLWARNEQGVDIRGDVSGDTAWEMVCRLLTTPMDTPVLSSRDIAQVLVYLLDDGQLPQQMRSELYDGAELELRDRGKTVQTENDEAAMKCRWLRLTIHKELDVCRECIGSAASVGMPIELEVEGAMIEAPMESISKEAEKEATELLGALKQARRHDEKHGQTGDWGEWGDSEDGDWDDCEEWGVDEDREELTMMAAEVGILTGAEAAAPKGSASVGLHDDALNQDVAAPGVQTSCVMSSAAHQWGAGLERSERRPAHVDHAPADAEVERLGGTETDVALGSVAPTPMTQQVPQVSAVDKPLVDPPEFADRIKDTEREPYWIPGAFPTIFQNETGDPFNYRLKEVDLPLWGPHILRSKGWVAQAHMTFMYWWMNMIQRMQALSAKKWFVRDNPQATGYTADDLATMSVSYLAKKMVGYTSGIPGSKASKAQIRRIILSMVRQIEIETRESANAPLGDIPCFFGTLTSQRYHWEGIIRVLAQIEGIDDYTTLSKSKRRELVNKYPLFVAWYCSMRLELVLKTIVVPIFGAFAYFGVYEWSPTGAMVHLHYVLWKSGAPRFDERADALKKQAAALRKHGSVSQGPVACQIGDVVDFFQKYITEWNLNKTNDGSDKKSHVAERVNEAIPHPAALSAKEMLDLLRDDNMEMRLDHYCRAVRFEQMHDFHYPDPLGPPNPSQPCATLLKGTRNMWHCKNGYPRDLVCEHCHQSVSQDALKPDIWRVCLMRNDPVMNGHMPLATLVNQSNTDASGVLTRDQADMYLCKYCTKHLKRCGQRSVLHEVLDDMRRLDQHAQEANGAEFERRTLGGKLHRAFMGEVGEEMSQAEVGHHANRGPEYLCSRLPKHVSFYKKALAIDVPKKSNSRKRKSMDAAPVYPPQPKLGTKPSDLELYERRTCYRFAEGTRPSDDLPLKETPEEQVLGMYAFDFFRLVSLRGGQHPLLQWYEPDSRPIVIISPVVKLTIGADFAFGARWALMQYHPWTDRRHFLDMSDTAVRDHFVKWIREPACPWFIVDQYISENGLRKTAGAGAVRPRVSEADRLVEEVAVADDSDSVCDVVAVSETEASSAGDIEPEESRETHVLKMLYEGNVAEINRRDEQARKAKVFNNKHDFHRNTRCTDVAQEEHSAFPAGVLNVNQDSDDEGAYAGEQLEIQKEMDELRAAQQWVNQEGWDMEEEAVAYSPAAGKNISLRLDWDDVKRKLDAGADGRDQAASACVDRSVVMTDFPLDRLDPTQRVFADRVLQWVREVIVVYQKVSSTGQHHELPRMRAWLGGSAGSGKSTTLKVVVQHARLLFKESGVDATIQLAAYTGVAAFNIGFGAMTACSGFQIFPNASWKAELQGDAYRRLEKTWSSVVLLIVDEVSFIGRCFFARIHYRLQQAKRQFFSEAGLDPNEYTFGNISILLVGDFGQLEPIDDWSMCDHEATFKDTPQRLRHLWKHSEYGKELVKTFDEAFMLRHIHRSKDDMQWTESCLRLRDFTCTWEDYMWWLEHDLDRGHLDDAQKAYFDNHAVWLCARCEDVGKRNGRKLAHAAEDQATIIHQIHAKNSCKSAKKYGSAAFSGLRPVINVVRGCKVMITRNVQYLFGLANGTRGTFVGAVYPPGAPAGTFPEALVVDVPQYCGPELYPGEPTWVVLLPSSLYKEGSKMLRTQFAVVAGWALTVNKAQGLTIKEGVVINLAGSQRFRPAGKHGLPFVAFTRSEGFAMTAFKNLPPWNDFVKGRSSDLLRQRLAFEKRLMIMHSRTLRKYSNTDSAEAEDAAFEEWYQSCPPRPQQESRPGLKCAACDAASW